MASVSKRIFIKGARLSYPSLDKPRESMNGEGEAKYQATFLLEPTNESVKLIKAAMVEVANQAFKEKAAGVLKNPEKLPLKEGDKKETIPEGYAGMLYIAARSKDKPELRDANPRILITEQEQIREKFIAGYKVNGFIDIYAYQVKQGNVVIKSGLAAGLVSVQFAGYADTFGGRGMTNADDYPDCTADAESTATYAPEATGQQAEPDFTGEGDGLPF